MYGENNVSWWAITLMVAFAISSLVLIYKYENCKKHTCVDHFNLEEDMNKNESNFSVTNRFDHKCCNSIYTNDKGCACDTGNDVMDIVRSRGGNNTTVVNDKY